MRTRTRLGALAIAAAFVVAACGGGGTTTPTPTSAPATAAASPTKPKFELATYMYAIQTKGKIRIGTRENNVPFGLKSPTTGKFEGFDIDVAREIAKSIFGDVANIDEFVEWVPVVSATRIPTIQENKADFVIATFTINEDRKKQIDFSDVYFRTGQRILVKKSNTDITSVATLTGKTVCAARGSTSEKNTAAANPQAKILSLEDYPACLLALRNNQADAVSTDETILFGLVKQDPDTKLVGPYFSDEPYGIGVKKNTGDRTGFVDHLNRTVVSLIQGGKWATFYKQWITPVSGDEKRTPDQK